MPRPYSIGQLGNCSATGSSGSPKRFQPDCMISRVWAFNSWPLTSARMNAIASSSAYR